MYNLLKKAIAHYYGRILGTIGGLVLALFIIYYGWLATSFIIALCAGGFFIGSRIDSDEDFRSILERLLPPVDL